MFKTRPHFEDRQIVQWSGETISLSGHTFINNNGFLQINGPLVDFTGSTSASTQYIVAGISGYINAGEISSFIVQPPIILQSGSTGTTTVDVTGYILGGLDSEGRVTWYPSSYFLTGSTSGGGSFTGNTSGDCINDLYVANLHGCSPIKLHDIISGYTTTNYIDMTSVSDEMRLYNVSYGSPSGLNIGGGLGGINLYAGSQTSLIMYGNLSQLTGLGQIYLSTTNKSIDQNTTFGTVISTTDSPGTGGSTFVVKANSSSGQVYGVVLTAGTLQGEIVLGRANPSLTGLPLGVMGTGLGEHTTAYGIAGYEYYPIFLSTPRSCAYDDTTYSTIKNTIFGGGSDNKVYTGVTNSALIGGSGNTIGSYTNNVALLGGRGNGISRGSNYSLVGGGVNNIIISGTSNTILGGINNTIDSHSYASIVGGSNNTIHAPTQVGVNEFIIGSKNCGITGTTNSSSYSSILGSNNSGIFESYRAMLINVPDDNTINSSSYTIMFGGDGDPNTIIGSDSSVILNSTGNYINGGGVAGDMFLHNISASNIIGSQQSYLLTSADLYLNGISDWFILGSSLLSITGVTLNSGGGFICNVVNTNIIDNQYKSVLINSRYDRIYGNDDAGDTNSFGTILMNSSGNTVYSYGFGANNDTHFNIILNGKNNIINTGSTFVNIIGGSDNTVGVNTTKSTVLNVGGLTAVTSNTVYVPDLVIKKSASVPTTSSDPVGENGSVTWDNNFFYWKANGQWLRISGQTF